MDENHMELVSVERQRVLDAEAAAKDPRAASQAEQDAADKARRQRIWEEAADRFTLFESGPEATQRAQEREDLQFDRARVEDIWPAEQRDARKGSTITAGGVAIQASARPMLVVNKLAQPVIQIINEGRQARIAPVVKAKPGRGNSDDAEVAQGLLRGIEASANADAARHWGFQRAVKCGRGYWRVETAYANDGDWQLDIVISRIKNQGAVYLDPYHAEPDGSDAMFAFITEQMPLKEFVKRWGKQAPEIIEQAKAAGDGFTSATDQVRDWISKDTVRIAEYFYVEMLDRWLVEDLATAGLEATPDADGLIDVEPPADLPPLPTGQPRRVRKVEKRVVKWCLLASGVVLLERDWPGRYIPIIQVIGREFNVDGEASYKGAITDAKDAVRVYCFAVSAEVEAVALAPRAPYVAAAGQLEKYRAIWSRANTHNFGWLPYEPVSIAGTLAPPPQRQAVEPAIGAIATLVQQADADIKAQTGRFDASLGNLSAGERSGKAINALKQQAELSSSDMMANYALSVRHECRVVMDLAQYVYTEPGRLMTMLGDDPGDESRVMLNQDFLQPEGEDPQPYPTGARLLMAQTKALATTGRSLPKPKRYDIAQIARSAGIVMDVGPSAKTQRDENLETLGMLTEGDPNMKGLLADIIAEEIGGPMGRKVADRMRAVNPQLQTPDGAEGLPPEAQAQIAAKDAQIAQMGQAMQQMQQALQINEAKQQATVAVAQIKVQGDLMKAKAKFEADAQIARVKLEAELEKMLAEHANEADLEEFKAAVQRALQDDEQRHELILREFDAAIATRDADAAAGREEAREFRAADRERGAEARDDVREVRREARQERRDAAVRADARDEAREARAHEARERAATPPTRQP